MVLWKFVLMKILFSKYHANGNDFILVMDGDFPEKLRQPAIISRLCHRQIGIGADWMFIICHSKDYDFLLERLPKNVMPAYDGLKLIL